MSTTGQDGDKPRKGSNSEFDGIAARIAGAATFQDFNPTESSAFAGMAEAITDDRIAKFFTEAVGEDWRYVNHWGKWHYWNTRFWPEDETDLVIHTVRSVCREAARCTDKLTQLPRIESATTVRNVERLLRADPKHARSSERWDRDIWLFNTPAGTYDLRSGQRHDHRRDDHITRMTRMSPEGDCPAWMTFLHEVTGGNNDLVLFLQRMVGYCLTGSTQEQCLFFLYGSGGNGKSLFVEVIAELLGEYATSAPMDMLMESHGDRHPTELAALRGPRLVTATETEDGRRWAEAKLKQMTGGDRITARFMRQDAFVFMPQFKIIICGNHKPALRSIGPAMRRRFQLVPFTVTIPEDKRDPDLKQKLLKEAPGILRWAIEGAQEWHGEGLRVPEIVRAATEEYFAEEDIVGLWLSECCVTDHAAMERVTHLYESYRLWCEARGERPRSAKWLSKALAERGFQRWREAHARGFYGLAVKSAAEQFATGTGS
jgi:putative DNA primase/helicase